MFSTIVVGIDGRAHDQEALALAQALADPGATIISEHVDDPDASVGRGLREAAARTGAELIVTGSSRRGIVGRTFAGNHVRDVLRHAPCPVAVAPVGYQRRDHGLARIGVGHDGSAEADAALRLALGLRSRDGATIDVVEVIEPYPLTPPAGEAMGTMLVADVRRARANLDRIIAETGLTGRIITGSAAHELARLGRSVDLIAVGLHQRGLLDRLLIGSTAHALLREQAAPVLVVPPAEAAAPAAAAAR